MSQPNLEAKILNQLRAIFANYPAIERVELYGSRAKGTEHPRSDIDLVAYGAKIDRFIVSQLLLDLDDSEIPYSVDLQNYHELRNHSLLQHIKRVGQEIYSRDAMPSP